MPSPKPVKHESVLLNLLFNIALPTLILTKLSTPNYLGPLWGLIVALLFPVCYGVWDFATRGKMNFISIIGFTSVLLTGGLGLLHVGAFWFAVKEASMPTIIGIAVVLSQKTKQPLVRELLFNEKVIDLPRINAALAERNAHPAFDRLLVLASYALAATFLASGVLNFVVARWLIHSEAGTAELNAELGKMNSLGLLVTAVPATIMLMLILWRLIAGIQKITGLDLDDILKSK